MNIVFMGTPDFAVPCLAGILDDGHTVSAVFTQPDRPRGRGNKLSPPPVKEFAEAREIPVHQPIALRNGKALALLKGYSPDLIVVVAYGRLLPVDILNLPPLGCVNVHASLLPRLRGSAPIQRCIINGDTTTGVTTMYMAEGMDTGDMILQRETSIGAEETAGELFKRLSVMGAELLGETLTLLENGTAPRTPQSDSAATYAPMIEKAMGALDFSRPAAELVNLIRGLNPSPFAYTLYSKGRLKVHKATVIPEMHGSPGEVLDARRMIVACGDSAIQLSIIQPQGKKPMDFAAFACSGNVKTGEIFTSA